MFLAACGSTVNTPPPQQLPHGKGAVVGGIEPCSGLPPSPGGPTYVAGMVRVLRGEVTWRPSGPGSLTAILPATQVDEQTVGTESRYRFVLNPGQYVLQAQYAGSRFAGPDAVRPYIPIIVRAGTTLAASIPNECK